MVVLGFALALVLVPLSTPLVGIVFGHGAFPPEMIPDVRATWLGFSVGLGAQVAQAVLVNGYVIIKGTRILLWVGVAILLMHVVLNPLFMPLWGVAGIAVTASVSYAVTAVALFLLFPSRERA